MSILWRLGTAISAAAMVGFALLATAVAGVELLVGGSPASLIMFVALIAASRFLLGSFLWGAAFMGVAFAILAPASPGLLVVTLSMGINVRAALALVSRIPAAWSAISDRRAGANGARI